MGSCCSCLCPDSIPDNHPTKFKVTNVDDEGHELGSGVMELTPRELILHTHKRDAVRWPYLSLRRYGFDSNLFSFESGRRCHTGQGIFAFKCSRAEEIFNLLQDLMQCNSINVVEEPVVITRNSHPQERELAHSPQGPASLGYTGLPNGFHSFPGESLSYSAAQHPSVSSLRHSSVGEDSTHPLLGPEEQCVYENLNGLVAPSTSSLCRAARSKASPEDGSCSQRRSALLHYENLPALPPVWELQPAQRGDEDTGTAPTPSPNGFSEAGEEEPLQNPAGSEPRRAFLPRPRRSRLPNVFSFDFPRPCPEPPRQLNYIQVELEPEVCKGQQEHRVAAPASPGARRTDSYAVIDLKKTAAMSSLQRALPRDDGTSRKTRHNSTDLPL
ncbi:fibroblast growth factor receptor substrate 3 isoform X2 [Haemorhous mexicanus]|uniref:fibroblast growth factor receptor substrate 3 isoform X2 n=1 Tax=Haemorhous mexicanus TaxID=30427 RepID=UPI0028BDE36B|nr:fibroblast growth factor receptor substrate 3 isoform X2 [Haemorhous mexicanus]